MILAYDGPDAHVHHTTTADSFLDFHAANIVELFFRNPTALDEKCFITLILCRLNLFRACR
jgi:hypothetical protein